MTADQWGDLARTLGIASPLVGLLWLLLRQATEERKTITDRFVAALETTVANSTQAQRENAIAISAVNREVEENRAASAKEHERIIDAIGKLGRRET